MSKVMELSKMAEISKEHTQKLIAIGGRIRAAREAAGMSMLDVEKSCGIFSASLSRIEHGVREGKPAAVMITTLYRIAKSIGVHPSVFLADVASPPRNIGAARLVGLVRRNMVRYRGVLQIGRRQLAHSIGSSQDCITRIEDGTNAKPVIPTLTMLMRIADALGVELVQLFLPDGAEYSNPV